MNVGRVFHRERVAISMVAMSQGLFPRILTAGRDMLVYHAYPASGPPGAGRESLLDTITWGADGWPTMNGGHGPTD
ncbi:MAG TPA: hypothetical protein VF018_11570 [Acidobacteriaceae bacterium]